MIDRKWLNSQKIALKRHWFDQPITSVISVLGSIASMVALCAIYYQENWIYLLFLAIFAFATFGILIHLIFQFRKLSISKKVPSLHSFNHNVRDATYYIRERFGDEKALESLRKALKEFSDIFSELTGRDCRTCIKEIYCDDESMVPRERAFKVRTLCRDDIKREKVDNQLSGDFLDRNTDFRELWLDTTMKCFFSNDLTREPYYDNSHWTPELKISGDYPYLSTIVWPIRMVHSTASRTPSDDEERHDIQGFLCVDSKDRYIFDEDMDSELGAACADALYTVLKSLSHVDSKQTILKDADKD